MVTPSGGRVEFRQIGATNTYETADSSYVQLKTPEGSNPNAPVENLTLTLTGTDGTQMTYTWKGGAFRCSQIKDRNGNYITVAHNDYGQLDTVTDTLGRVIKVRYVDGYPSTIDQAWGSGTNGSGALNNIDTNPHTWATFSYTTKSISTDFDGSLSVIGPTNTTAVKVLEKITYADNSFTKFHYNGYAQVFKVENFAADSGLLNHVRTNLETPNANQFDCPRFTETRNKVKDFNGENEVVINNSLTTGQSYSPPVGATETVTKIDVWITSHPNNVLNRTFVAESGWREGLPLSTGDWSETSSGWERKRWTWTNYTQDNTSLAYTLNPRVIESRVGDGTNTKKTAVEYHMTGSPAVAHYGLVKKVEIGDLSTIFKKIETEYNLSTAYTDRRIIGLPAETRAWGKNDQTQNPEFVSKTTYLYDQGNFGDSSLNQNITAAAQYDAAAYGLSFITGRGNLTSTTRCDAAVSNEITCNNGVTSSVKYNTTGSVVSQTDPAGRVVKIGYTDSFTSSLTVPTFAYPTSITGPTGSVLGATGQTSTVIYRYDIGANVQATSPPPDDLTQGKTSKRVFDSVGRLERDSIYIDTTLQAYTRYSRPNPDTGVQSFTHSTLVDNNTNGADAGDEVTTETLLDGAGRVRKSRQPHTFDNNGATVTWSATVTEYDKVGRVVKQSIPTEVNSSWAAAGEDASRGFLWTHQKYDWMGRVTRKIGTDGDPEAVENNSDILISYSTCGCAGGQVTTIQGEKVQVPDQGTTHARRTQKVYADPLGRDFKTETFGWDGYTLYSTGMTKFNGRDQVIEADQTDNSVNPTVAQITSRTYDGFGRLKTQHRPDQNANTYTTYNYNTDDSISSVTDARGATVTYSYGAQGLPVFVQYGVPQNSNIEVPSNVVFYYDALGNRTRMEDGVGEVDYNYNSLSQLTSESRSLDDIPVTPAVGDGDKYTIGYSYHIGGQLKSYTDPNGREIKYTHDKIGRLSTVTGTLSSATTEYADNPNYRAWGALTHLDYGNGTEMNVGGFNNKLQATTFELKRGTTQLMSKAYSFHTDGQVKLETDNLNSKFNRSYMFDHVGRLQQARSGANATGGTAAAANIPYKNDFQYNAFDNQTQNTFTHYSRTGTVPQTYTNNRVFGGTYDAEGNQTVDASFASKLYSYNAAGNMSKTIYEECCEPVTVQREFLTYGGDGYLVKTATSVQVNEDPAETDANYSIRSSVLRGEIISSVTVTGAISATYVRANGTVVAIENMTANPVWTHKDPAVTSIRSTDHNGQLMTGGVSDFLAKELDPSGSEIGFEDPYLITIYDPDPGFIEPFQSFGNLANGQATTYIVDGMQVPRNHFNRMFDFGFQGFFGAIERQAAMSRQIGGWRKIPKRPGTGSPPSIGGGSSEETPPDANNPDNVIGFADFDTDEGPVRNHYDPVYSENWALNSLLSPPPLDEHYEYLGDEKKLIDSIKGIIIYAKRKPECTKAFEAAGVTPINDQLNNLTIITESMFEEPLYDKRWTKDSDVGKEMRAALRANPNALDVSWPGLYGNTGHRFLGITDKGADGKLERLSVVIIHSLVHTGGKPGKESQTWGDWWNGAKPHDLKYLGDLYKDILKHCTKEGGSKNIYGV